MKPEQNNILDKIDHRDGLTVPDGYFADFASRMAASLPERPELEKPKAAAPRSTWHRVRPYVYMAAMFAGVWCMLKMFTMFTGTSDGLSIDDHPGLANAVSNEQFVEDYIISDISDWDIYNSMVEDSIDMTAIGDSLLLIDEDFMLPIDEAIPGDEEDDAQPILPQ